MIFVFSLRHLRGVLFNYVGYVSTRFAWHIFAWSLSMVCIFNLSYSGSFFVAFYLSFYYILALGASARDTFCLRPQAHP